MQTQPASDRSPSHTLVRALSWLILLLLVAAMGYAGTLSWLNWDAISV